eukprot:TRINITY_DN59180_c0_g1_i1.p1 TRINITY_DN59180_c0_g1~~TRINITY_DN59180_c0_g1_i1.p1  ORF type:complete len:138 (-),score=17.54 TRINITY_DN59180_c0_g1_i1:6-419(-)
MNTLVITAEVVLKGTLSGEYLGNVTHYNVQAIPHPSEPGLFIFPVHQSDRVMMIGGRLSTLDQVGQQWSGPNMVADHWRCVDRFVDGDEVSTKEAIVQAWNRSDEYGRYWRGQPQTFTIYKLQATMSGQPADLSVIF